MSHPDPGRAEPEPPRADPRRGVPRVRRRAAIATRRSTTSRAPPRPPRAGSTSTSRPRRRSSASSWTRPPTSSSRKVERAVAVETEPVARAEAAIHTVLTTFAGHRTMARLLFLDTMGAGRVFQAETNDLHDRFARLIQGYLDDAVAAGAIPPIDTRLTSIAWFGALNEVVARWLLADDPEPARGRVPGAARVAAAVASACPRRGSARCRCPATAGRSRRRRVTAPATPGRAPGAGAGERLAALARRGRDRRPARSPRRRSVDRVRPDRALRRGGRGRPRGRALAAAVGGHGVRRDRAGVGRRGDGPDRFATPRPPGASCSRGAARPADDAIARCAGPVLLGGLGFTAGAPDADDAWAPFGASSLVLPELLLTVTPRSATVVTCDRAGDARTPTPAASTTVGTPGRPGAGARARPERHRRRAGVRAAADRRGAPGPRRVASGWSGMFAGAVGRGRIDKVVLARRVGLRSPVELDVAERAAPPRRERPGEHDLRVPARRADVPRRHAGAPRRGRRAGRSGPSPSRASIRRGADAAEDAAARPRRCSRREKDREEHADRRRRDPRPARADRRRAHGSRPSPRVMTLRFVQHLVTEITGTLPEGPACSRSASGSTRRRPSAASRATSRSR